jgi:tRNA (guanine-N7-)-methyltransferase
VSGGFAPETLPSAGDRLSELTPVRWRAVFGNDRSVEVEIGPGRGETLLAAAAARPGVNLFGIEHNARAAETLTGVVATRGLTNVRIVAGDARCIVGRLVPDASVAAYYIYFPDPWPKTRHRDRRLAAPDFGRHLLRTLTAHGRIHVLTDLAPLLATFVTQLTRVGLVHDPAAEPPAGRPSTHYERKYAAVGACYARFTRP